MYLAPTVRGWDENTISSGSESQLITLQNQARASGGLRTLKLDTALRTIARWRSKDMVERDYFSHTIPGSGTDHNVFWYMQHEYGYCFKVAGENIGQATWPGASEADVTAYIFELFMNSSGHRANIMGKAWDVVAVGAFRAAGDHYVWTVLFADKCGTAPTPTPEPTPKPTPQPTPKPTPEADTPARPPTRPPTRPAQPRPPHADAQAHAQADSEPDAQAHAQADSEPDAQAHAQADSEARRPSPLRGRPRSPRSRRRPPRRRRSLPRRFRRLPRVPRRRSPRPPRRPHTERPKPTPSPDPKPVAPPLPVEPRRDPRPGTEATSRRAACG